VSDSVTLSLRAAPAHRVHVEGITGDCLATRGEHEIASLPVSIGRREARIGDIFDVRGGRSARVRLCGALDMVDGIAAGQTGGELVIDGNAGRCVAARMSGGAVTVRGSAGDDAGVALAGGTLRIDGNAGHRLGAALPGASKGMTAGEIIVIGSAGDDVAARARRGLVVVGGSTGRDAARAMIAGTLIVVGRVGDDPGRQNKRASIIAIGGIAIPATYRFACTLQPPYVRFVLTYVRRRYGVVIDHAAVEGAYRRYCGDAGVPGKGEILEWAQ
jgi:formylmethanofuran dehydrogenase subunit C